MPEQGARHCCHQKEFSQPWLTMIRKSISSLSPGQRECLLLVWQHYGSKEIASILGVSHHTVDDRLKAAIKTLGVANRRDAARALIEAESAMTHQPLGLEPQASGLCEPGQFASDPSSATDGKADSVSRFPLPYRTRETPKNDLSVIHRLAWIIALTAASIFALGVLIAGLVALSQVI